MKQKQTNINEIKGIILPETLTDCVKPSKYSYKQATLERVADKYVKKKDSNKRELKCFKEKINLIFDQHFIENYSIPFDTDVIVFGTFYANVFTMKVEDIAINESLIEYKKTLK